MAQAASRSLIEWLCITGIVAVCAGIGVAVFALTDKYWAAIGVSGVMIGVGGYLSYRSQRISDPAIFKPWRNAAIILECLALVLFLVAIMMGQKS